MCHSEPRSRRAPVLQLRLRDVSLSWPAPGCAVMPGPGHPWCHCTAACSGLLSSTYGQTSLEVLPLKILILTQEDTNYHFPTGLHVKPQVLNFISYVCEQACQMAGQLIYFCKVQKCFFSIEEQWIHLLHIFCTLCPWGENYHLISRNELYITVNKTFCVF